MKNSLGDFQKSPSKDLWPDIERKLNKRDKKRAVVIPLWWKTGAIVTAAASLALIILLNPIKGLEQTLDKGAVSIVEKIQKSTVAEDALKTSVGGSDASSQEDSAIASEKSSSGARQNQTADSSVEQGFKAPPKNTLTQSSEAQNAITQIKQQFDTQSQIIKSTEKDNLKSAITSVEPQVMDVQTTVVQTTVAQTAEPQATESQAKEIRFSEPTDIAENTEIAEALTGPVTSLVGEEEQAELIKPEAVNPNWSIMPVAGPVYYNSLSQGSVFDPSLSDNARQGDVTFSYGLRVNIDFDNRLTLRAGIHNVAMGYATQDIEIATGPAAFGLTSVTYNDNRNIISVFDKGTVPVNPDPSNPYNQLNLKSTSGETSLRANLNYLEFPIELSYALIDQQVKLSVISGVSGLLLSNNEVSVNDGQNRYVLGSLNNLNQFSFSTNIGLGFSYKVFKDLNLQLEPTFKYQLGAYNDANVDFTPYQLVLLSGLQFQF